MQDPIAPIQDSDYIILFQPVLVPRNAIQSLSVMPLPMPPQLSVLPASMPQQPIAVQPGQMSLPSAPVQAEPLYQEDAPTAPSCLPENPRQKQSNGLATEKQLEWVQSIARKQKLSDAEICEMTGTASLDQMTKAQASAFINEYKKN